MRSGLNRLRAHAPTTDGRGRHRALRPAAVGTALALLLAGAGIWALPAQAAPGDTSAATGQYLNGSLLGLDAALVASLGGEAAVSNGAADQTNANNLNVGVLGAVTLTAPGGIQLPLDLGSAGVVGQYASALQNGSSVGASGLTSATGDIGTGITPAPGVAPGPLHLNLAQAVSSLGLPTATLNEVAQLDLTVGITAARAAQAAPGAATGSYSIASAGLSFQSPTLAALTTAITNQVATVQTAVDGLSGPGGTLATSLAGLPLAGVLTTSATVGAVNLQSAVAPLLTGTITDPAYPGIAIDLGTGTVTVDLGAITALEGLAPNTNVLSGPVIAEIGNRITGVVGSLLTRVQNTLTTAIDALGVTAGVSVLGAPVVTVNSTVGALLGGDTSGIALAGAGLALPLGTVLSALTGPLNSVGALVTALGPAVIAPVANTLVPALDPVLSQVVTLTANNQSTAGGVFTETALRATVLPATSALVLNVANASVGPDAVPAPPTATGITPAQGPQAGGTTVTITGTGFTGATGVTFGGTPGSTFTVVNDTTITVTTPAHAPGAVNVVVQHPLGDTAPLTYTYLAAPAITAVAPTSGPQTGGTPVTITGSGFTGATAVTFGGTPATGVTVVNDTTITATTPAHAVGPVGVVVTAPGGQSVPGDFTFLPVPAISSIAPASGPDTGGTHVTITGSGFTGATGVTFAGSPDTAFPVVNDTTITATTPAGIPGPANVVVLSPAANSTPGIFTYLAVPAITGITPNSGPQTGGTAVTITGSGFTGSTGVTFGGVPATGVAVVNDTTITATTPAHAPGAVNVVVQNPVADSAPGTFTYLAVPAITGITPNSGPQTGGTAVTITGSGFTGATGVTFDGISGVGFTVVNDTTITVATPAHAPGAVNVVVQHPVADSAPGTFTYLAVPAITGITPNSGPQTGGTSITITGSGFTGATGVTVGGAPATGVTVVNDTTITATTPAGTPGPANVVVQSPVADSGPGTFTYLAVPAIASLTPTYGPQTGGTTVTITGTGFTGATGVTFGGAPGTAFTVVNDTTITVTTPAHAPGAVGVIVQHPNGASSPGTFTFDVVPGAPTISGLAPDHGPARGGTTVTISGSGFTGATSVTIGGQSVPFTVVGDGTITITTPAHAAGAVPIVVTTPVGSTPPAPFTYDAGTTVDGVTPSSGPSGGGTTVTVTGGCFTGATAVLFGTTPATSFTVIDDATLTAVSPAGAGTVDITVVGAAACGTATLPGGFHYVDPAAGGGSTGAASAGSDPNGLADTGTDTGNATLLAGLGLLLILGGALIVLRRTRRA